MIDPAPTPKSCIFFKAVNSSLPSLLAIANVCFWYGCITASFPFCLQKCHFWTASCKPYEAATHGMLPGAFASFMSDVYHHSHSSCIQLLTHRISWGVWCGAGVWCDGNYTSEISQKDSILDSHFCVPKRNAARNSWWPLLGIVTPTGYHILQPHPWWWMMLGHCFFNIPEMIWPHSTGLIRNTVIPTILHQEGLMTNPYRSKCTLGKLIGHWSLKTWVLRALKKSPFLWLQFCKFDTSKVRRTFSHAPMFRSHCFNCW